MNPKLVVLKTSVFDEECISFLQNLPMLKRGKFKHTMQTYTVNMPLQNVQNQEMMKQIFVLTENTAKAFINLQAVSLLILSQMH